MHTSIAKVITGIILLLSLVSCNKIADPNKISQGIIEYDIQYDKDLQRQVPTFLMPKKMTMKFNRQYSMNQIEGFMGLFSLTNISNSKGNKHTTLLKIFEKKYSYVGSRKDKPSWFDQMDDLEIIATGEKKTIAGIECQGASIKLQGEEMVLFDVYYSNEFNIREPNFANPYHDIEGVLLEFVLYVSGIRMHLVAKSVKNTEVGNDHFTVSPDHQAISKAKMEEFIAALLK
jgi:hypothetical protein